MFIVQATGDAVTVLILTFPHLVKNIPAKAFKNTHLLGSIYIEMLQKMPSTLTSWTPCMMLHK